MRSERRAEWKVILAAIVGHTFWGFSFLASRRALDSAHMFLLLSHRFVLALAAMSLLALARLAELRLRGKRVWLLVVLGVAEPVIYFFGEQYGIMHTTTIFSGAMIALVPAVATLAAMPILKERPNAEQLLFSFVSIASVVGIGMLSQSSGVLEWDGVAALTVAVLAATVYTLLSRGLSEEFSPFERTYMMMAVGAVVFTVLALVHCEGSVSAYLLPLRDGGYLLAVLFLALCCSVGSYFLSGYAITYMPVARETVFVNLTTAVSVFAGAVFLHEPLTPPGVVFCALILLGIYGVQCAAPAEDAEKGEKTP